MLANNNKNIHFVDVTYVINRMHHNGWDVPKCLMECGDAGNFLSAPVMHQPIMSSFFTFFQSLTVSCYL